jgi:hypothetical protein
VLAVLLAAAPATRAQALGEAVQVGDCFRYTLEMKLSGEMRFAREGKVVAVPLSATASHTFAERVLVLGKAGLVEKAARVYDSARASIRAGEDRSERNLRPARKLIVAQRHKDQKLVYSPQGALSRAELEVVGEHLDTLVLGAIVASRPFKTGETWKLDNAVAQALCALEGITKHDLTARLGAADKGTAAFTIRGSAEGVENGALVKLQVEARGEFDLKAKRLTSLEWKQKDDRDQGPVSPKMTAQSTVTMKRQAIAQPASLADAALVSVPEGFTPPAPMVQVEYRDPKGRFAFLHGRDWQVVSATDEHTVLRCLDRGDFVAQLTVTPWSKAKKGEHLSAEAFKTAMNNTSGWRPEKELQSGVVPADDGRWIYRYSVVGQLEGVGVLQNFFLVAGPGGEQVVLAFTLTPKQADKLGARDLSLAGSLEVPAVK